MFVNNDKNNNSSSSSNNNNNNNNNNGKNIYNDLSVNIFSSSRENK